MTEQNKNEASELESKWQEDLLLALSRYKDNYQESFNNLPLSLQDEAHGINYERGLDSDEIIAFMVAYLAACKARHAEYGNYQEMLEFISSRDLLVENKKLKAENDSLLTQIADFVQRNEADIKYLEQEIERMKKELKEFKK